MEVFSAGSSMQPGTRIDIRMLRTDDGVWLQQKTHWHYYVKFFKVVGVRGERTTTRSDFHRFEVSSRMIAEP